MLVRICVVALMLAIISLAPASADVFRVELDASAQNYTGACPIDIVFTATIDGDPGTVFKRQFSGTVFPSTQATYSYIPTSGTLSIDDDITVDAAHAGKFEPVVSITPYSNGGSVEGKTITSTPVDVSVTCLAPGQSPPPLAPTPSASSAH